MLMWGVQGHQYATQRLPPSLEAPAGRRSLGEGGRPTGRLKCTLLCMCVVVLGGLLHVPAYAIDVHPTAQQIQTALAQGKEAAQKGRSPDSFYVRFGVADEVLPKGFLITKIGALSVMATHMALRGLQPSEADVTQVLEGNTMLISTVIFGNTQNFAVDSYMVLNQGEKTINPMMVRFDAQANRSDVWPKSPQFKAKVVATFNYADFDPTSTTSITVYPGTGGESSFSVDFGEIQ
ncbi:MAG: hypothetical protein HY281_13025 [Nitrospirae bacterium]|nr:hypothetical protein [Nitrospirota bacterium]